MNGGPKKVPRGPQDRPKLDPRTRPKHANGNGLFYAPSQGARRWVPQPQDSSSRFQEGPKTPLLELPSACLANLCMCLPSPLQRQSKPKRTPRGPQHVPRGPQEPIGTRGHPRGHKRFSLNHRKNALRFWPLSGFDNKFTEGEPKKDQAQPHAAPEDPRTPQDAPREAQGLRRDLKVPQDAPQKHQMKT